MKSYLKLFIEVKKNPLTVERIVNDGKFTIVRTIFPSRKSEYFLFAMSYNSSYYATILLIFHQFLKTNTGSTSSKQTLEVWWR
jgi:hypothetical protein